MSRAFPGKNFIGSEAAKRFLRCVSMTAIQPRQGGGNLPQACLKSQKRRNKKPAPKGRPCKVTGYGYSTYAYVQMTSPVVRRITFLTLGLSICGMV